jgi:hypothetical protein
MEESSPIQGCQAAAVVVDDDHHHENRLLHDQIKH